MYETLHITELLPLYKINFATLFFFLNNSRMFAADIFHFYVLSSSCDTFREADCPTN